MSSTPDTWISVKGVGTLVESAIELLVRRKRTDACFLLCGNRDEESSPYERIYSGMGIEHLIHFAGYRSDLAQIFPSCFCGVIPSTGWDSFPRTSVEMAAVSGRVADRGVALCKECRRPFSTGKLACCLNRVMHANWRTAWSCC